MLCVDTLELKRAWGKEGTYRGIKGHVCTAGMGLGREAPGADLVRGEVIAVARLKFITGVWGWMNKVCVVKSCVRMCE